MLRNSTVDLWRALVGLSAEKSIVVPLRRSPLNSCRSANSSIVVLKVWLGSNPDFTRLDNDARILVAALIRASLSNRVKSGFDPSQTLRFSRLEKRMRPQYL